MIIEHAVIAKTPYIFEGFREALLESFTSVEVGLSPKGLTHETASFINDLCKWFYLNALKNGCIDYDYDRCKVLGKTLCEIVIGDNKRFLYNNYERHVFVLNSLAKSLGTLYFEMGADEMIELVEVVKEL